jgi:hypothetical protein
LHILLARNYWQMDACGRRRQAVHGSVNIYSPDASVRGNASLVAFSNRSHCIRTPGSARTCSSWVMDIDVSAIVTDDAASQKRARHDRDGFAHAPVICADCPGPAMLCRCSGPTRGCAGPEHDLLPRDTGSGTAPIPCGGQTGRSICRGNRDSALIRKAKQPRDRVLIMPFDISPDAASRALGRVKHGGKTVIGSQIGGR